MRRLGRHPEIPVKVNAWVDQGVAPLVEKLNAFRGIATLDSCQGDPATARTQAKGAYVMFKEITGGWSEFASGLAAWLDKQAVPEFLVQIEWRPGYRNAEPLLILTCPHDHVERIVQALRDWDGPS